MLLPPVSGTRVHLFLMLTALKSGGGWNLLQDQLLLL